MFLLEMGGDRCRFEPISCENFKKKGLIWKILEDGGVTPYIEKLHGHGPKVTKAFMKGLKD